jgi:hypothetical protein
MPGWYPPAVQLIGEAVQLSGAVGQLSGGAAQSMGRLFFLEAPHLGP